MTERRWFSLNAGASNWLWLGVAVMAFDQWTKSLIVERFDEFGHVDLLPVLQLMRLHNKGAAFSFLSDADGWQRWVFIGLGVAVSVGILIWLRRLPPKGQGLLAAGLSLILGGALGNVIDRVVLGHVIDFIRVQRWLASSYWTPDISMDRVIRAAQGSAIVLSAHHPKFGQVAYGRVVSDFARFAYIGDIWVDDAHRGRGLARALVEFAIEHPEFEQVRTWTLATRDAHGVYEPLGFLPMSHPNAHAQTWMVRRVGDAGWLAGAGNGPDVT